MGLPERDAGSGVRYSSGTIAGIDSLEPRYLRYRTGVRGIVDADERESALAEAREYSEMMLVELRKVIAGFLSRVDVEERGDRMERIL